ncbi:MAG: N-acetylmuramoyl-L-alanine amidase [Planctomycetota bacterium]|jgi:N-acetyl-anhydromuramyl-L-alanine amidase AmpD
MRCIAWLCLFLLACQAPEPRIGERLPRRGDEIMVCGQLFHTGTPVVLWTDPDGYDAYRPHAHRDEAKAQPRRFGTYRRNLPAGVEQRVKKHGWRLEDLQRVVRQVVVHYDAAGTSARCFEILHDIRGLSSHFMLDTDGTIYQTLDLKERAWHAGKANDVSVGIEIANLGAYPDSSKGPVEGRIQGGVLYQWPFTDAQYESLARLCATLARVLPRIRLEFPRDARGAVIPHVLDDEGRSFAGILGHYHLTKAKVDPGPAFDWERLARRMEELR